jgi:hypothetical protein
MAVNPLWYNNFVKSERHNSTNPICRLYEKQTEQMINIYGVTMFYFPISEYDLQGIAKLWGEDINKKYLEKYTLKGITEGESDNFVFNRFGVDKTTAERVVFISRKAFREITGRQEPLEGDMFQWTQNQIIYEIIEVTDQENIVLGMEMTWKLVATPRWVEGEVFGKDDCSSTRDQVVDPGQSGIPIEDCDKNKPPPGDGNVITDPTVNVPGPTPHKEDDETIIDQEKADSILRNSWGNL